MNLHFTWRLSDSLSVGFRCWGPLGSWGNSDGVNLYSGGDSLDGSLSNDGNDSIDGGGLLVGGSLKWRSDGEGLGEVFNFLFIYPLRSVRLDIGVSVNGGMSVAVAVKVT